MECRTKRLLIRDFVAEDREAVRTWRCDPEVTRYLDQPRGSDPDTWFDTVLRFGAQMRRAAHDAAIVLRSSGEVIGWIGIGRSTEPSAGDYVVGYALARAWWGHGYMTEALVAVLSFGFSELGARSISAQCYVANPASARVMQKAGMRPAGRASSANPALGESVRHIAIRDKWRRPGRRRFGLMVVVGLVALLALPAGIGPVVDYLRRPDAPDDARLLPWTPRGALVDDHDFVSQAGEVWRDAAERTERSGQAGPTQLGTIYPVWAGVIGSGRIALLQAVDGDGAAYVAQVAEHGSPAVLRFDRQERIGDTRPPALVVNYDGNVDLPMLEPGAGAALLQLVLAPDAASGRPTASAAGDDADAQGSQVGADDGSGPVDRADDAGATPPGGKVTLWRRVREVPDAAESPWKQLRLGGAGLTATWLHLDTRSPEGSVVVMARPVAGSADTVTTLAAAPDRLLARHPHIALADPTWGPMYDVDLQAYDDARVAAGRVDGVSPATTADGEEVAPLAAARIGAGRVAVLETRTPGKTWIELVAWNGSQIACVAKRDYAHLEQRVLVSLGCTDPKTGEVVLAIAARPGVDRLDVREPPGETQTLPGPPPLLTRVPARDAPKRPLVVTAVYAGGTHADTETLEVSAAPRPRQ